MAIKALPQSSYNYVSGETGKVTRISLFEYQRPGPNSRTVTNPLGLITLPLPDNMPNNYYSMNIGAADLGLFGAATNISENKGSITSLQKTIKEKLGAADTFMGDVAAYAVGALALAPNIADLGTGAGETAQATAGIVRNPHTAMLFNGVNLREFTLNWRLSPRNEQQSRSINQIINVLKLAMHPDLELYGFALNYPNLVRIDFNNDKESMINIDLAFISDLSVNPTPSGHAYYRNGHPSIIDLSMHVKEIRIKTTDDFTSGGITAAGGRFTTPSGPSMSPVRGVG